MKRLLPAILALSLLLTGCGWLDGSYSRITPHQQHFAGSETQVNEAGNYLQLRNALVNMVDTGEESRVISVVGFKEEQLAQSMDMAVRYIKNNYPVGAYAVESVTYELGNIGGALAVSVNITYTHGKSEIRKIRQVTSMEQARSLIEEALNQYDTSLVMLIVGYEPEDIHQLVDDFAAENPDVVMETPTLSVETYPDAGFKRVMEIKFTYQSSRDSLRSMREVVRRVFSSADLYVSNDASDDQKLSQLYAFLMERFDSYQIKTSITPAYSLLNHGVGDSAAFAKVYAQMCERVDIECLVVVGTRNGEPWCWNIVQKDGYFYHVDLLDCQSRNDFRTLTDGQMADYVWDYSAYPACTGRPAVEAPEETTDPSRETADPSEETTNPSEETVPAEETTEPENI